MELNSNKSRIKKENLLESYEALFHEYYRALVRYGITLLKNADEAEDIVQQVFVNLWERNQWQTAHTSIQSLLYTAVYNACLNKIKQDQVRHKYATHKTKEMTAENISYISTQKGLTEQITARFEKEKLNTIIKVVRETLGSTYAVERGNYILKGDSCK